MFPFASVSVSRQSPEPMVPASEFSLLWVMVIGTSAVMEPKLVRASTV